MVRQHDGAVGDSGGAVGGGGEHAHGFVDDGVEVGEVFERAGRDGGGCGGGGGVGGEELLREEGEGARVGDEEVDGEGECCACGFGAGDSGGEERGWLVRVGGLGKGSGGGGAGRVGGRTGIKACRL